MYDSPKLLVKMVDHDVRPKFEIPINVYLKFVWNFNDDFIIIINVMSNSK